MKTSTLALFGVIFGCSTLAFATTISHKAHDAKTNVHPVMIGTVPPSCPPSDPDCPLN